MSIGETQPPTSRKCEPANLSLQCQSKRQSPYICKHPPLRTLAPQYQSERHCPNIRAHKDSIHPDTSRFNAKHWIAFTHLKQGSPTCTWFFSSHRGFGLCAHGRAQIDHTSARVAKYFNECFTHDAASKYRKFGGERPNGMHANSPTWCQQNLPWESHSTPEK
jgi:hypothetical protein